MTQDVVIVARRFRGPPASGNGGYVSGRLASHVGSTATVRLRTPPPLEVPLAVERTGAGARLRHGTVTVAEARPARLELDVPSPPCFDEAGAASRSYRGFDAHPFPECFVCGPSRKPGEGMRIFPGRIRASSIVAAPWVADQTLATASGEVRPEFLWAALDCPGAFTAESFWTRPMVLGELTARLERPLRVGEPSVVLGWPLGRRGRKHFAGTAVFSEEGRCAVAMATWIELRTAGAHPKAT